MNRRLFAKVLWYLMLRIMIRGTSSPFVTAITELAPENRYSVTTTHLNNMLCHVRGIVRWNCIQILDSNVLKARFVVEVEYRLGQCLTLFRLVEFGT